MADYFDHWYADMTVSPVKDKIQQLTRRVMATATAP